MLCIPAAIQPASNVMLRDKAASPCCARGVHATRDARKASNDSRKQCHQAGSPTKWTSPLVFF